MTEYPRRAEAPGVHPDAPELFTELSVTGLMIATPMGGGGVCDQAYAIGYGDLRVECALRGIPVYSTVIRNESDVQQGRNRCFAHFLASPCSHMLFIDSDIGFSPDAVFRLIAHDRPIVGATYAKKAMGEPQYAVSTMPTMESTDAGLIEVGGLPGGFLMVQRGAAERLAGAYRDLHFTAQDGDPSTEGWRGHLYNLFGAEMAEGTRWSEDLAFCRRWRAIGGRVWLDPHILLEHWGMARFAGHPMEMFRAVEAEAPAEIPADASLAALRDKVDALSQAMFPCLSEVREATVRLCSIVEALSSRGPA